MPPHPEVNPRGFWEDVELNSFNNEVLAALQTEWHGLTLVDSEDVVFLRRRGLLLKAADLLKKKIDGVPVFGVKDPRMAKLLPFWREVFGFCNLSVGYVLPLRNPMSVAHSLAKAQGLDIEKGYLLWQEHVVTALVGTKGCRRAIFDYDAFVDAPEACIRKAASSLGLTVEDIALRSYLSEFWDAKLRRSKYTPAQLDLDGDCPVLVAEIYRYMLDHLSRDAGDEDLDSTADEWLRELKRGRTTLAWADRLWRRANLARQELGELSQAFSQRGAELALHAQRLADAEAELDGLRKLVTDGNAEIAAPEHLAEAHAAELVSSKELLLQEEIDVPALTRKLAEKDERLSTSIRLLADKESELEEAHHLLNKRNVQLTSLSEQARATKTELSARKLDLSRADLELAALSVRVSQSEERVTSVTGLLAARESELAARDAELAALSERMSQSEERMTSMTGLLTAKGLELEALLDKVAEQQVEIQRLEREIAERNNEVLAHAEALVKLEGQASMLSGLLRARDQALVEMVNSVSWKLTTPLRMLAGVALSRRER